MIEKTFVHKPAFIIKVARVTARAGLWCGKRAAFCALLRLALVLMGLANPANAADFMPSRAESAVEQPSSPKTVGQLAAGTYYRLLKLGGPAGGWCKLQLPQNTGWVLCSTGTLRDNIAKSSPAIWPLVPGRDEAERLTPAPGFDYYLLSLSWSPTFCSDRAEGAPEQCRLGKHYGFVVHGLWPQGESGRNPMSCTSAFALSPDLVQQTLRFMPSQRLIEHEWEKHGTCSGLSPEEYFAKARRAHESIRIPDELQQPTQPIGATLEEIESKFMKANPGLEADMIAVLCHGNVSEIRFCLDKDLKPRRCGHGVLDSCRGRAIFSPSR